MFPIQCDGRDKFLRFWSRQCKADAKWHLGRHDVDNHGDVEHIHELLCDKHYHLGILDMARVVKETHAGDRMNTCTRCNVNTGRLSNILHEMELI